MAERTVDYSPLLTQPTPQEVRAFRAAARASGRFSGATNVVGIVVGVFAVVVAAIIVVPMLIGGVRMVGAALEDRSPIAFFFLFLGILAVIILTLAVVGLVRSGVGRWGRWLRMDRFAAANGLVFSPRDPDPAYPGMIFQTGDSRAATDHFRTAQGRFLDFGNYQYDTGSGKSRSTHKWGFLAVKLDRRLPNMVLDSKANNGLLGGSNLPAYFDKSQVLSLEGDFDRSFTLYCPKEYERDALYVFTPDLMALLIDEAAPFDVEIVDDWMFVYSAAPFPPADPAVYQRLFRIVETVGAKTLAQTDRYHDDRAAAPFSANVVAPQGARLKRGVSIGTIIVILALGLLWGWGFVSDILEGFGG